MTATDRLNVMQARCDAATEGPWRESWPGQCCEDNCCVEGPQGRPGIHQNATDLSKRDAEFIAHARTDLPATIAALRAVLDLHPRIETHHFATYECANCLEPFPCSTVRAITEALT